MEPAQTANTAAEIVYRGLWEDIRRGITPPGSPVIEETLAERFGVSRTPVREALRRLAQDGLLERSSRGLVVTRLSQQKMQQIYPIVAVLEGLAARDAASDPNAAVSDMLERLHDEMRTACTADDAARFIDLNTHFHSVIIDHTGNPLLIAALQRFRAMMHHYRVMSLHMPGRMADSMTEHRRIVDAIRAGDGAAAEAAMRQHIERSQAILAATFRVIDLHGHRLGDGKGG